VLAASLIERIGTGAVIALGGVVMAMVGLVFSWALQRRGERMRIAKALD
jgi:YNFM family putative membrane transporter